ncbi:uncharacterized protein BX663DRAFT_503833 [Cokeromyces recurvatus]|uniref:uncharacterized protein n=1 Tax=Cokeromyces recurvatus TaxID=90255 RepID=UPI00221FB279|nr:uncharacterized protein BX663DRAFT_503833 [Cokeromyces recurvatus]KAI7904863.1 hypothetical protein BX663DRAFT_503833 [Cokeromyces recurvatus]
MVLHRRGGSIGKALNSNVGRRRKTQQQQQQQQQTTKKRRRRRRRRSLQYVSEDNSTDSSSTTRCVCGETHNMGLMVQCDKCEVWQHCECMGLDQPNIPDHYYCELCKPENHKIVSSYNGRVKRQYISLERTPKKRTTLNSREASMSLEDVLAARDALEMYEAHKDDISANNEEQINKRKRGLEIQVPDTIDEKSEPASSTVASQDEVTMTATATPTEIKEHDGSDIEKTPSQPMLKKQTVKSEEKKRTYSNRNNRRGKPRSRTSTPTRESSPMASPDISFYDTNNHSDDSHSSSSIATLLFEHFSPEARAASPPAKTRQPHVRMSLSEMNRRANQILEYISSIQVEMATKEDHVSINRAGHGLISTVINNNTPFDNDNNDDDDNDSLSSASTIPLESDEEAVDKENQSSFEIMDMLTRKLIKFQRRFGPRSNMLYDEGRITRSHRESNGNTNIHRNNMMAH